VTILDPRSKSAIAMPRSRPDPKSHVPRASRHFALYLIAAACLASGCADVDTTYGRVDAPTINGTTLLAEAFRARSEVRTATFLNDEVGDWAQTIVRFASYSGAPGAEEAEWYEKWLTSGAGRQLIYVPLDFNAALEYWETLLAELPADAKPETKDRYERAKQRTTHGQWEEFLAPKKRADPETWFAVDESSSTVVCKTLEGPWAKGVDARAAGIARRRTIKLEERTLLLSGDGKPLVVEWLNPDGGRVLVVANGSFLLNEPLTRKARRPLAARVVDWAGADPGHVVFVEGPSPVLGGGGAAPTLFDLLWVDPLGWIGGHLIVLGVVGGVAMAVRLGRSRGGPASGADRPAAHAEALGDLLARTTDVEAAQGQIDSYHRWRQQIPAQKTRGRNPFGRA
jgi:hypothetical protein